jgi:hypothetical protein
MSGMGRDRSLAVGEQSVEVLHPHWKTLVWPVVSACAVVAALLAGEVLIPSAETRQSSGCALRTALRMTGAPTSAERRGTLRNCD